MLKPFCFFSLLACCLCFSQAAFAQWSRVGDTLDGGNIFTNLAMAPDGTLYAAWSTNGGYAVRRFDGTAWQQFPSPPVRNGNGQFVLATDHSGVLYLATDTSATSGSPSRILILKYDSAQWKGVGLSSRFVNPGGGMEPALTFDIQNRPVYAYTQINGGAVIRFNGKNWDQIAGLASPFSYLAMSGAASGDIYTVAGDTTVSKYVGNATWNPLSKVGLEHANASASVLTAASDGNLYVEFLPVYGRGPTTIHQYNGTAWTQLGRTFQSGYLSHILIGAGGARYTFFNNMEAQDSLRILRYNGQDWTSVAADGGSYFASTVLEQGGSLYAAIIDSDAASFVRVMKYDTRNDALSILPAAVNQPVVIVPVPASESLEIRNTNSAWNGKSASILDLQGRLVERVVLESKLRVRTASWPAGAYQLLLPDGSALRILKN